MDSVNKKFYVNFLGCEKRKLDSQRVINYLKANGWRSAQNIKEADLIIFLTCAFCKKYEDYSIGKLQKVYKQKKDTTIFVVGGCLTIINPKRLEQFPDILQIQTRELDKLDNIIHASVPMNQIPDTNITIFDTQRISGLNITEKSDEDEDDDKEESDELVKQIEYRSMRKGKRFRTPAQKLYEKAKLGFKIRINWGCLGNCAYCVTKLAEKTLESKVLHLIIQEFKEGLQKGHKSFFFTGGDSGAYGLDINLNIVALLTEIFKIDGEYTIHFHDFGVHWLQKFYSQLLPLFQKNIHHLGCFSLPIQSGSDKILALMRRPYKAQEIKNLLIDLKRKVPSLLIGTHFMTGFPGETEEDFLQSVELVQEIPFDFLNVFQYTDHERADSFHFSNKVPFIENNRRSTILFQTFYETFKKNHKML